MLQAVHKGAERNCLFKNEAEGPIPVFSPPAQSQPFSDGAFFGSAKNVTSECPIPTTASGVSPAPHAEARHRPPMRLHARQGTAFSKTTEASALAHDQAPNGNPPLTQAHPSSIGSGFPNISDAPASPLLFSPKNAQGDPDAAPPLNLTMEAHNSLLAPFSENGAAINPAPSKISTAPSKFQPEVTGHSKTPHVRGLCDVSLDFSQRFSPKDIDVIEHRQNTLKAIASIMGWSESESQKHGMGRKYVKNGVYNLRQSIIDRVNIIDPEHFKDEQCRNNFLFCHSRYQKGKTAYNATGAKNIIYSCGDKYCPDCAKRKSDNGILELYSDWTAISKKLGIPTVIKVVFTLPNDLAELWADDKEKIDYLSKKIKRILCKLLGFRVKDNLSIIINPHPFGDGAPITPRLHFHATCLPVSFNKITNNTAKTIYTNNEKDSSDISSDDEIEEDNNDNEACSNEADDDNAISSKDKTKYDIRVSLLSHVTLDAIDQMAKQWRDVVASLINDSEYELQEYLVVNYSYIPIMKYIAEETVCDSVDYNLKTKKEFQLCAKNTKYDFVDSLPDDKKTKAKPKAFKHALEYNGRSFLPSLFNRIIAHDETGAIYPKEGWQGAEGQTWEYIADHAIKIAESKDKSIEGIYAARCFGLAKKRKKQLEYIELEKKYHPLPPVSEEDATFEKQYYKEISIDGESRTIKLRDKYIATLDDGNVLDNVDFGVHARKYYDINNMFRDVTYIIPKSSLFKSFIIEKPSYEDFLERATRRSLIDIVKKAKQIIATDYYNHARERIELITGLHMRHYSKTGKSFKKTSWIDEVMGGRDLPEHENTMIQASLIDKKPVKPLATICIPVDSEFSTDDITILNLQHNKFEFDLTSQGLKYYAEDNVISKDRIYKALENFCSVELPFIRMDEDSWYGEIPIERRKKHGVGSYKWQCEYVLQISKLPIIDKTQTTDEYINKYRKQLMAKNNE